MRTLTIEYGPGAGGSPHISSYDVVNEYGQRCNGLCLGEMLEQVFGLVDRGRARYQMLTPDGWQAQFDATRERAKERRALVVTKQARAAMALQRLYDVSAGMDAEIEGYRPSEDAYQAAMAEAKAALDNLDVPF